MVLRTIGRAILYRDIPRLTLFTHSLYRLQLDSPYSILCLSSWRRQEHFQFADTHMLMHSLPYGGDP